MTISGSKNIKKLALWSNIFKYPNLVTTKSGRKGLTRELIRKGRTASDILFTNKMLRWKDKGMPGGMATRYALELPTDWADHLWSIPGMLSDDRTH